jgi:hypothetical protein
MPAVCDHRLMFRDVFEGWPGSAHDGRVTKKSPLSQSPLENSLPEDLHLLGYSAYAPQLNSFQVFRLVILFCDSS